MLKVSRGTSVETSPDFDRRWFFAQSILQAVLALLVVLGLAGVFGGGWLSTAHARIGPVDVTYDRFARRSVPIRITLQDIGHRSTDPLRVSLSRDLIGKAVIVRTIPAALSSHETADGTEMSFAVDHPQAPVVISVQPDRFGIFDWTLRVEGLGAASLFQIIYP